LDGRPIFPGVLLRALAAAVCYPISNIVVIQIIVFRLAKKKTESEKTEIERQRQKWRECWPLRNTLLRYMCNSIKSTQAQRKEKKKEKEKKNLQRQVRFHVRIESFLPYIAVDPEQPAQSRSMVGRETKTGRA
jgi:hypothetical protein